MYVRTGRKVLLSDELRRIGIYAGSPMPCVRTHGPDQQEVPRYPGTQTGWLQQLRISDTATCTVQYVDRTEPEVPVLFRNHIQVRLAVLLVSPLADVQ